MDAHRAAPGLSGPLPGSSPWVSARPAGPAGWLPDRRIWDKNNQRMEWVKMEVIMKIGENSAEIETKDFEEDAFYRMIPLAVRTFADACLSAGASAEDVEDVVMGAVQDALEASGVKRRR